MRVLSGWWSCRSRYNMGRDACNVMALRQCIGRAKVVAAYGPRV